MTETVELDQKGLEAAKEAYVRVFVPMGDNALHAAITAYLTRSDPAVMDRVTTDEADNRTALPPYTRMDSVSPKSYAIHPFGHVVHWADYKALLDHLLPYRDELLNIAEQVGEPDDPFAAWEVIEALRTSQPEPASGWKPIEADTATPAIVCAFGDPDRHWLPMTAYRATGGKWERPASRDGLPYEPTHYLSLSDLPTPPAKEPK